MNIVTSAVGLPINGRKVFVANMSNNWCQGVFDFSTQQPLTLTKDKDWLELTSHTLKPGEEFKLIVPYFGAKAASEAYAKRQDVGVHIGLRYDYDTNTGHFWLLAKSHKVVRPGSWDQNNVYE